MDSRECISPVTHVTGEKLIVLTFTRETMTAMFDILQLIRSKTDRMMIDIGISYNVAIYAEFIQVKIRAPKEKIDEITDYIKTIVKLHLQ